MKIADSQGEAMVTPPMSRYRQVAQRIRDAIRRGEYKPGDQIPAESAIAEEMGVSRLTVNQGLKVLINEGLLEVQFGRGTYVRAPSDALKIAAEALHRNRSGLDDPVGECPDPETHGEHDSDAQAVIGALQTTGVLETRIGDE